MVTKDHLKSVLSGEKSFIKIKDVRFCNPPSYDEIGVKHLYDKVISLEGMAQYFPDKYGKGRSCCRSYMYNIWNTIYPDDVASVIEFANRKRYSVTNEDVKGNVIQVTDEW